MSLRNSSQAHRRTEEQQQANVDRDLIAQITALNEQLKKGQQELKEAQGKDCPADRRSRGPLCPGHPQHPLLLHHNIRSLASRGRNTRTSWACLRSCSRRSPTSRASSSISARTMPSGSLRRKGRRNFKEGKPNTIPTPDWRQLLAFFTRSHGRTQGVSRHTGRRQASI